MKQASSLLLFCCILALPGCTEHASEADKTAAAHQAAARQQQADEAAAARRGIQAAEGRLAQLPPPAKGRYLRVRSSGNWGNPFMVVGRRSIILRVVLPAGMAKPPNGAPPRADLALAPDGKHELTLRIIDLPEALAALPDDSWPYGRVVAVEEDPAVPRRERPQMRRNVEHAHHGFNDLDVVADEWPNGAR